MSALEETAPARLKANGEEMIRVFCAILAAVLQVLLLSSEAGIQPALQEMVAAVFLGDLAWYLFEQLFFY